MSVSNRSRSPRSGGKSAEPKKRAKRAKSELHAPKRLKAFTEQESKEDVRKKVLQALEHLGHQKLSKEAGGYSLKSWTKSLKTLLDDFEDKVGSDSLSDEFKAKRKEIEAQFSKGVDASQVEAEIDAVRREEKDIRAKLKEESARIAERLSAIGGEKTGKAQELDEERKNLQKLRDERKSVSFFSRLVGKSGPSTEPAEKRVKELENGLKMLEEETTNLQAVRKSIEGAKDAAGGIYADLWVRLGALEKKTEELDDLRQARLHLAKEREEASESLRKVISELKLEPEEKSA